jgi:hypothetical protein
LNFCLKFARLSGGLCITLLQAVQQSTGAIAIGPLMQVGSELKVVVCVCVRVCVSWERGWV